MRYQTALSLGKLAVEFSLSIFLLSCSKDDNNKTTDCQLASFTFIEIEADPNAEPDHDTTKYILEYNTDWDLITMEDNWDHYYKYIYNGDGILVRIEEYFLDQLKYYYILTWNEAQMTFQEWSKINGSFIPEDYKKIFYFSNEDHIVKIEYYLKDDNNNWILIRYEAFNWENNDITRIDSFNEDSELEYTEEHTFDSNPNPFYNLKAYWYVMPYFLLISENNLTSISIGGFREYFYLTYNRDDYPVMMRIEPPSGEIGRLEWHFEYNCE